MPERTFRIVIQNFTESLTLNHQFSHLCGGDWTPGGWTPPPTIAPGTSGGMQSESGGVLTGTEGYTKYEVNGPGGGKKGLLYVYWNNPFWGVTHFRHQAVDTDIFPDCDFDPPSGASGFDSSNLSFTCEFGALSHTDSGTDVTAPGDLLNLFFGPATLFSGASPAVMFTMLAGIMKDPVLYLRVNDHVLPPPPPPPPPPSFGDLGPRSWRPMMDATPEQWLGNWGHGRVSLNITDTNAEPPLFAALADWTMTPPLLLNESFTPGAEGLLIAAAPLIHSAVQFHGSDVLLRPVFAKAARSVLKRATEKPMSAATAVSAFKQTVGSIATSIPTSVVHAKAGIMGMAIGNLLKDKGGVAYLGHQVALKLFGIFQSGTQTGSQILYQRLHTDGLPLSSVMLDPILDIR